MKKLLLIGLVVVLVAVGASVTTGRIFQEQLANLEAEINKDPRLNAVSNPVDEGLFSTSGSMTISMNLEDDQRLIIKNPWHASHLPGWVSYQGQTLLTLEAGEEVINLLEELDLGTLEFQGKAGWKKATFAMAVEPFLFEDGYAKLEMSGVDLTGTYYYSGRQVGKLIAENVALMEKGNATTELEFEDLELSWDQKGSYPFVQGDAELLAESIYFSSPQGQVAFNKPNWNQALVFNKETFDYKMSLDLGQVINQGQDLGTGKLSLKTASFNGQAVADLLELLAANSRYDEMADNDVKAVMSALDKLLGGSPALVLEEFKFNVKEPVTFKQEATGELSFDGSNLPINYLEQLDDGSLNSDDAIKRSRLELNFNKIEPSLLMLVGIPPSILNQDADVQKLVFEAGELKLNGQLLPF